MTYPIFVKFFEMCFVQGVRVNQIMVGPQNISATFFSDRIETISQATSAEMQQALMAEGCLNSTGYLIDNPRYSLFFSGRLPLPT